MISISASKQDDKKLKEVESVMTDVVLMLKRSEEVLAALADKYQKELGVQNGEVVSVKNGYGSVRKLLDLVIEYVSLGDIIEDESGLKRLKDFLEKMGCKKYVREEAE